MHELLKYALLNNELGGRVREYVEVIDSWRNGNEEERRAYKFFMKNHKKLYKEAKSYLENSAMYISQ